MQTTEQYVLALAQARGDIAFSVVPFHCMHYCMQSSTVKRFFSLGEFAQRTPQRSSIPTWHYSLEPELLSPGTHANRTDHPKRRGI